MPCNVWISVVTKPPQNESVKSAILRACFAIVELKVLVHIYVSILAAPQVVPKELCEDTTSRKEDSKLIVFQT